MIIRSFTSLLFHFPHSDFQIRKTQSWTSQLELLSIKDEAKLLLDREHRANSLNNFKEFFKPLLDSTLKSL